MSAKNYILFDLDGTLTDPKEGITKSVQYALHNIGIEEDCDNLLRFIGPPLMDSFREFYGLDDETCDRAVGYYRKRYAKTGIFENKMFDDVHDTLKELKARGKVLGVATSKPEVFAVKICDKYHLSEYMDVIAGSGLDGSYYHKSDVIKKALDILKIPAKDAVMVGDRKHDIIGAKKFDMLTIGVRCGYAEENELEDSGADYVVDNLYGITELELLR